MTTHAEQLARLAGAMPIGDPAFGVQYLFTAEQIAELIRLVDPGVAALCALADRLEKSGVPVKLYC